MKNNTVFKINTPVKQKNNISGALKALQCICVCCFNFDTDASSLLDLLGMLYLSTEPQIFYDNCITF